jgi:hypothetical protein
MTASSPNDTLGLFDTPPNSAEIRFGYLIVGVLIATFLVVLLFRDIRLRNVTAFIPTVDSIIFVGDLITATLLFGQSSLFQSRALRLLATGYLFGALLLIPHALTFPGAFSAEGLQSERRLRAEAVRRRDGSALHVPDILLREDPRRESCTSAPPYSMLIKSALFYSRRSSM